FLLTEPIDLLIQFRLAAILQALDELFQVLNGVALLLAGVLKLVLPKRLSGDLHPVGDAGLRALVSGVVHLARGFGIAFLAVLAELFHLLQEFIQALAQFLLGVGRVIEASPFLRLQLVEAGARSTRALLPPGPFALSAPSPPGHPRRPPPPPRPPPPL